MGKTMRTVYIEDRINEKLKTEPNASGLVNDLLEQHFDMRVLEEHLPGTEELDSKAKELHLKLEELDQKKKEVEDMEVLTKRLAKIGIENAFLIDRLKKSKHKPNVETIRHLKQEYGIKEALQIWEAWNILHPESDE